ncbi:MULTISPECIES: Pr6Pr family membrane protein [Acidobacteriaceae]|uniref:Pr6Pr family membrane protein n=1 Tax=Acidobacteriaceae TaxID=204434 RepID=UPI00131C703F|nr:MULTISPECIES: Pr6Pr family membrane protein [Acidobacteriaceae]MDW5264114.1 Pr6Pr family membrane protein [Edaphobacter sp.]
MAKRYILAAARLFFGLLTLAAIITSFIDSVIQSSNSATNFFSFFTILTNLFVAIVLIVSAANLIRHRDPTEADDILRGSATVSIAIVGLVFGLLLSHLDSGLIPWTNFVLHSLMPVVMVLDWLIQPPKAKLVPRHIWFWVVYPIAYLAYSLIRGAFTNWYPYWFIDPNKSPGGWTGVAVHSAAITIGFLAVSFLLLWLGNKFKRNVI